MMAEGESCRWRRYEAGARSDEDLQALRALLAEYTEAEVARRLSPNPEGDSMPWEEEPVPASVTPLDALIRLFYQGIYVSEEELPADVLDLLGRLDLIAYDSEFAGLVYATAAIVRVAGELTLCDRSGAPDGSLFPVQPDFVYPPIFDNVRRFLASLPSTPCDAMLEIGTGTGIAAIVGARHAQRVWATDITSRAVHFAGLGCRMAGLDNVTVLEGDLYGPVEGLTFDRIAIHPPWIPASQSKFVYGDGGDDGESIIRGSIEGLPQFLRPGGRFYASLLASDREGDKFEQRVRRWLGVTEDRFDITVAELARDSPDGFLKQNLAKGTICEKDVPGWIELWKVTRTEAIVYGHLIVERHEGEREPVTSRVPFRSGPGPSVASA